VASKVTSVTIVLSKVGIVTTTHGEIPEAVADQEETPGAVPPEATHERLKPKKKVTLNTTTLNRDPKTIKWHVPLPGLTKNVLSSGWKEWHPRMMR
jgi:hypothetical protein